MTVVCVTFFMNVPDKGIPGIKCVEEKKKVPDSEFKETSVTLGISGTQ